MAKLVPNKRTGEMTKVTWQPIVDGELVSRSKQFETEDQALTYKGLVEQNGEEFPTYQDLRQHGLIEYGFPVNPKFVLGLYDIVVRDDLQDDQKLQLLRSILVRF